MYGPTGEDEFDWTGCSTVQWDARKLGGRANVAGTRMFADTVLACSSDGMSEDEIADIYEMELAHVKALVNFAALRQLKVSA